MTFHTFAYYLNSLYVHLFQHKGDISRLVFILRYSSSTIVYVR